jgi:CMP-N-acetylneuraminic acid synthetase
LPIAIIPARGGSKGIPRKNLVEIGGKPLIGHTIDAALESGCFDRVVVSTEDGEIAAVARAFGAAVIDRPSSLADDHSSTLDVLQHVLPLLEGDGWRRPSFGLLQPTSPLRNARHVREAWAAYQHGGAKALVAVTEAEHHPLKMLLRDADGAVRPVSTFADMTAARQLLPTALRVNGALYFVDWAHFLEAGTVFADPTAVYHMSQAESIDVDSMADLDEAARLLQGLSGAAKAADRR